MKTRSAPALPALALPRLSSQLETLVDRLAEAAVEFGITVDEHLAPRLATIACVNGARLARTDPEAAGRLDSLLRADGLPPEGELEGVVDAAAPALDSADGWVAALSNLLAGRWENSADHASASSPRLALLCRVLHALRSGLVVGRSHRDAGRKLEELVQAMPSENQFLSGCLASWRHHDWQPPGAPFVEYVAQSYRPGTRERRILRAHVDRVYPVAKSLDDPWRVGFWAETGWHGAQEFARNHPAECRELLREAEPATLTGCHHLFADCVLGTASPGGEVRIERATLRFFGRHSEMAQSYCLGAEPRRVARLAYDFAFWMGTFASFPVPPRNH